MLFKGRAFGHWPAVARTALGQVRILEAAGFVVLLEVSPRGQSPTAWSTDSNLGYFGKSREGPAELRGGRKPSHRARCTRLGHNFVDVTSIYSLGGGIIGGSFSPLVFLHVFYPMC